MQQAPQILIVSSDEKETHLFWEMLCPHSILTCAKKLPEFKILLQGGQYDLVLCEWSFALGTWMEVLKEVREHHLDIPVIVFSKTAGERDWLTVLEAGAFDLLVQPHRPEVLLAVVEQAVAARRARLSTKEPLRKPSSHQGKTA